MQLDNAIKERHSVKKFKRDKKPDWRAIIDAIDAARYAPMAGNNFSLKFILVSDKEKIKKIADFCDQPFVGTAHYVVVACSNPSRTVNSFKHRGEIYVRQQAGAAIQNFLLKIEESGLATTWVGHFEENLIKRELSIPKDIYIEAIFPIGYRFEKSKTRKLKVDIDSILYFDKYNNKKMTPLREFSA